MACYLNRTTQNVLDTNFAPPLTQDTKMRVLGRVARLLSDDGALYLGVDETTAGVSKNFLPIEPEIGVFGVNRPDRPVSQSIAVGDWQVGTQSSARESA